MANTQYIVFEINEIEFAIDIANIKDILRPVEFFKIPNTPNYIKGLIQHRGDVHAVINLRQRMHMPKIEKVEDEDEDLSKIIIVDNNGMVAGFLIDTVNRMTRIEDENIKATPDFLENVNKDFVKNIFEEKDAQIYILNMDVILAMKDDAPKIV